MINWTADELAAMEAADAEIEAEFTEATPEERQLSRELDTIPHKKKKQWEHSKEYNKKYYQEHKEEMLEKNRIWRQSHREEVNASERARRNKRVSTEEGRMAEREKSRRHRETMSEEDKKQQYERVREWVKNNEEKEREYQKQYREKHKYELKAKKDRKTLENINLALEAVGYKKEDEYSYSKNGVLISTSGTALRVTIGGMDYTVTSEELRALSRLAKRWEVIRGYSDGL